MKTRQTSRDIPVFNQPQDVSQDTGTTPEIRNNSDGRNIPASNASQDEPQDEDNTDSVENTSQQLKSIKFGIEVNYQEDYEDHPTYNAKVISRTGKANGKYAHTWNTRRPDGSNHVVYFSRLHCWSEKLECTDQENIIDMSLQGCSDQ